MLSRLIWVAIVAFWGIRFAAADIVIEDDGIECRSVCICICDTVVDRKTIHRHRRKTHRYHRKSRHHKKYRYRKKRKRHHHHYRKQRKAKGATEGDGTVERRVQKDESVDSRLERKESVGEKSVHPRDLEISKNAKRSVNGDEGGRIENRGKVRESSAEKAKREIKSPDSGKGVSTTVSAPVVQKPTTRKEGEKKPTDEPESNRERRYYVCFENLQRVGSEDEPYIFFEKCQIREKPCESAKLKTFGEYGSRKKADRALRGCIESDEKIFVRGI